MSLELFKTNRTLMGGLLCSLFILFSILSSAFAAPGVAIVKTSYIGNDGGASCPGNSLTRTTNSVPITYCFEVNNTGDEILSNVLVVDNIINYTNNIGGTIGVGGSVTSFVNSVVTADVINIASVFADGLTGSVTDTGGTIVDRVGPCPSECFVMSDVENNSETPSETDFLLKFDLDDGTTELVGTNGTGAFCLENLTFAPRRGNETFPTLFAAEGCAVGGDASGRIGTINITNGVWTGYTNLIGAGIGYLDKVDDFPDFVSMLDIDGLEFDQSQGAVTNSYGAILWASVRRTGTDANDLLINIDPDTGRIVPGAFVNIEGFFNTNQLILVDFLTVSNVIQVVTNPTNASIVVTNILDDVDDMAVDDVSGFSGELRLIMNDSGSGDELVVVNKQDGSVFTHFPILQDGTSIPFTDMEGLSFDTSGILYGTAGNQGAPPNSLFQIDLNGEAIQLGSIVGTNPLTGNIFSDFEGVDCFLTTIEQENHIEGTVFYDPIMDGTYDGNETVIEGVTVFLYRDFNTNGVLETNIDILVAQQVTSTNGMYDFEVGVNLSYLLATDELTIPPEGCGYTTPNLSARTIPFLCGVNEVGVDFGIATCTAIGDFVWDDLNEDGIQDAGEPGVTNVMVTLRDSTLGFITNTVTDASGMYLFQFLSQSNYFVEFELPTDYVRSPQFAAAVTNDSDANITTGISGSVSTTNLFPATVLVFTNDTIDAGIFLPNDVGVVKSSTYPNNGNGLVTFSYVFTVTNNGPRVATNIVVEDTLPIGLDFVSGSGFGTYTATNRLYTETVASLAAGLSTNVSIIVEVTNTTAGALENEVCVMIDLPETTTTNNCSTNFLGLLGDRLFVDENSDGAQTSGEPGVAGQLITLIDTNSNPIATTSTDTNGFYFFTVPAGDYAVEFSAPSNVAFTVANATNDIIDSDANVTNGQTAVYSIAAGETNLTIDAGILPPLVEILKVALPAQGPGTNALGNVLFDYAITITNSGASVATDIYWFDPLPAGLLATGVSPGPATYDPTNRLVTVNIPSLLPAVGVTFTVSVEVVDSGVIDALLPVVDAAILLPDTVDCDAFATNSLSTNALENIAKVVVEFLSTNTTIIDCDNEMLALIGDYVFVDLTIDGQQAGDPGVAGVTVNLQNTSGVVLATTSTDTNGYYEFVVPAGSYQVEFVAPAGAVFTTQNSGLDVSDSDANITNGLSDVVTVVEGEINRTIDAGIIPPDLTIIKSVQSPQASPTNALFTYTLTVTNSSASGVTNAVILDPLPQGVTFVSDSPAIGAAPGNVYTATVDLPGNSSTSVVLTVTIDPINAAAIEAAAAAGQIVTTAVDAVDCPTYTDSSTLSNSLQNTAKVTYQIPFITNVVTDCDDALLALLGDTVFHDLDVNGQQNSEPGVPGVTVNLQDTNGTVLASTVTDTNGLYEFVIPAGTYQVEFVAPAGAGFTTQNSGLDVSDSDANVTNGLSDAVTVGAGEINRTIDAGIVPPDLSIIKTLGPAQASSTNALFTYTLTVTNSSLSGVTNAVILDPLPQGVTYVSDSPAIGAAPGNVYTATIDLAGNSSTSIVLTVTIDPADAASIEAASASGQNVLTFPEAVDCATYSATNVLTNVLQNVAKVSYTVPFTTNIATDCDDELLALLGDYVFIDTNRDGLQPGEPGVPGVTVNLQDTNGTVLASTLTDTNGLYEFVIPAGSYQVEFVPPAGYAFTSQNSGDDEQDSDANVTNGVSDSVTVAAGQINRTIDAGLLPPDVTITKLIGPLFTGTGNEQFEYELIVSNVSASDATNVQVIDPLPAGLTFVTDIPDYGGVNASNVYVGTIPSIPANSSTSVFLRVRVTDSEVIDAALPTNITTTVAVDPIDCVGITTNSLPSTNALQNNAKVVVPIPFSTNSVIDCDEELLGLLGDFVFVDEVLNGQQDIGEPGVPGVTVNLQDTNGNVLASTITDTNGYYEFVVPAGDYVVAFVAASGTAWTTQNVAPDATDSDANVTNGLTEVVSIAAGEINRTIDAGILPPDVTITKLVGAASSNATTETFAYILIVSNVSAADAVNAQVLDILPDNITYLDDNGAGGTESAGVYENTIALLPGNTATTLTLNVEVTSATLIDAALPTNDTLVVVAAPIDCAGLTTNSLPATNALQNNAKVSVPVPFSTNVVEDCDEALLALIGDYVFLDLNTNGVQDASDLARSGVTVNLYDATGTTNLASKVTDGNGEYSFVVPGGTYIVEFVQPAGFAFTTANAVGSDARDSDADVTNGRAPAVTVLPGEINRTIDAGLLPPDILLLKTTGPASASAGDVTFTYVLTVTNSSLSDAVNVSLIDPIPVGVTYLGDNGAGGSVDMGTRTYSNLLSVVSAGSSTSITLNVSVTNSAVIDAAVDQGDTVIQPVDPMDCATLAPGVLSTNALQNTAKIELTISNSVQTITDCDEDRLALIGDFVFLDEIINGQQDGSEPGVPGVVVNLQATNGTVLGSTVTDTNGYYEFVVPAGDYVIEFVTPAGAALTSQNVGNDASDSDADASSGLSDVVSVLAGQIDRTIDAGLLPPQVSITKLVSAATANNAGEQFAYTLIVSNIGPANAVNALVFDILPVGVSYIDDNGAGGSESGGVYQNTLALLAANTSTTLVLNVEVTDSSAVNAALPTNDLMVVSIDTNTCAGITTNSLSSTNALQNNAKVEVMSPFSTNAVIDCDNARTALIGDYIWLDVNGDGVQDGSDIPQAGVTVNLLDATGTTNLATKVTGVGGIYEFVVPAGTYIVEFVAPAGLAFTTQDVPSDDTVDSDANSSGRAIAVTVAEGEINRTIDAGLIAADIDIFKTFGNVIASVGGDLTYEYILTITNVSASDAINVGLSDPLPVGLGYNNDGGAGGSFSAGTRTYTNNIALIPAGVSTSVTLSVSVTNALAIAATLPVTGNYPVDPTVSCTNLTSATLSTNTLENVARVALTLSGSTNQTIDCDNNRLALIGDYVFVDEDLSNTQNAGDLGVANVSVDLLTATGTNALATTFTDANGLYAFAVPPGTYRVRFNIPTFYSIIDQDIGGNDELDSDANPSTNLVDRGYTATVTVGEGDVDRSLDAGINFNDLNIYGSVLFDDDNDADFGDPDAPIAGVPVELWVSFSPICDATAVPLFRFATTLTDTNGAYAFTNVVPACYLVVENNLTNYVSTGDISAPNDDIIPIQLTTNDSSGNTFLDTLPVVIGDLVFNDSDGNGSQAGEAGISNVVVNLLDTNLAVIGTTTTDVNGAYSFTPLPGEYSVEFVPSSLPASYAFTTPDSAGDDTLDSDANTVTGRTPTTGFLLAGTTNTTMDAGAFELGCIGDTVWADGNGDGIPGEPLATEGIPDITVTLELSTTSGYINVATTQTVATASNRGFYSFCDLLPGMYRVTVDTADPDIPLNLSFSNSTPTVYNVTMVPGLNSDTNDFGFVPLPTAVTLTRFSATATDSGVLTEWTTTAETDTLGFNVYRSETADGARIQVGTFVLSSGNASGGTYSLLDTANSSGYYWLEELEQDFDTAIYGPAIVEGTVDEVIGTIDVEQEGVYRILLDDPATAGVLVDGEEVAALEGPNYLIVYVPYGGAEVVVANMPAAKRMGLVERDPNFGSSQLEIVGLDQEGNASFTTSANADNYLVLGFEGQPVVLDTTDAYNPVAIIGMALESTSSATQTTVTAIYFGYDADKDVFASDLDPDE